MQIIKRSSSRDRCLLMLLKRSSVRLSVLPVSFYLYSSSNDYRRLIGLSITLENQSIFNMLQRIYMFYMDWSPWSFISYRSSQRKIPLLTSGTFVDIKRVSQERQISANVIKKSIGRTGLLLFMQLFNDYRRRLGPLFNF